LHPSYRPIVGFFVGAVFNLPPSTGEATWSDSDC